MLVAVIDCCKIFMVCVSVQATNNIITVTRNRLYTTVHHSAVYPEKTHIDNRCETTQTMTVGYRCLSAAFSKARVKVV